MTGCGDDMIEDPINRQKVIGLKINFQTELMISDLQAV